MREKRNIYQEVTDRIVAKLEEGTVPWHRPWKSGGASLLPINVRTAKPYRGINIMLLGLEALDKGYDDNRWGTFKALQEQAVAEAKAEGRKIVAETAKGRKQFYEIIDGEKTWFAGGVRKGEKGTEIVFWKRIEPREGEIDPSTGEPRRPFFMLRTYYVFNVEQCDGIAALPVEDLPEHERIAEADALVNGYVNISGEFTDNPGPFASFGGDRAYYSLLNDKVKVPRLEQFDGAPEHYSTLFHEIVHSTGHESRLKRIEPALFGSDPYAKEELVAELGAAMLCGSIGIETTFDNSAAYIANWLGVLKDDPKLVVSAAAQAQKAVDLVVGTTFEEEAGDSASSSETLAGVAS